MLVPALFVVLGFFLLVKGADLFVDNASGLAYRMKVSSVVIGLTIVAFGTSMPELAVSVTAAIQGSNEIAVGNVIGSNIFNLLVVAGASACIYPLAIHSVLMRRDWPWSIYVSGVLLVFILIHQDISRWESILLLVLFGALLTKQIRSAKETKDQSVKSAKSLGRLIFFLIVGIIGIIAGGQLVVEGASNLARLWGWSESLIGLTIVAIGTSLPELMTSIVAARKGENEIAMGNVIGSNLFNILCILGISGTLRPMKVDIWAAQDCLVLLLVSIIYYGVVKKWGLNRRCGLCMVLTYVIYMVWLFVR